MRATVSRRRRRTDPPVVAVTGASVGLGRALLGRLAVREDLAGLVGLDVSDREPPTGWPESGWPEVEWRSLDDRLDDRDPLVVKAFANVDVVVHLAMSFDLSAEPARRRLINVRGTAKVLAAAEQAGAYRVIVVTSSDVYDAHPHGPIPLPDDAELRADLDDGLVGDLLEVERLVGGLRRSKLEVTIVRPAPLIGGPLGPAYDGALPRQLGATRLLALRGTEPLWQVCHSDDLLTALELAVTGAVVGVVPVACDGWLRQSEVEVLTGKRRLELPAGVAQSTAQRLRRVGVSASPPQELDRLLAPIVVDTTVLRAAGWSPQWTNESALQAYLQATPASDSRSGAYTAAGATVALVGTAALVRRARRRRHSRLL